METICFCIQWNIIVLVIFIGVALESHWLPEGLQKKTMSWIIKNELLRDVFFIPWLTLVNQTSYHCYLGIIKLSKQWAPCPSTRQAPASAAEAKGGTVKWGVDKRSGKWQTWITFKTCGPGIHHADGSLRAVHILSFSSCCGSVNVWCSTQHCICPVSNAMIKSWLQGISTVFAHRTLWTSSCRITTKTSSLIVCW